MVAKRGDLKPVDEWEENIRNNAQYYNVVGWRPGGQKKEYQRFDNLVWAKAYAKELMKEKADRIRTAMIYAVGEYDHHALVGSYDINEQWKPVIPKRY